MEEGSNLTSSLSPHIHPPVALSLISLIHRLHQQCLLVSSGKGIDESELISSQLITCFTILQGLCLKDFESQRMCGRKSTLEVSREGINAVMSAVY